MSIRIFLILLCVILGSCKVPQQYNEERLTRNVYNYLAGNDTIVGKYDLYVYSMIYGRLYFKQSSECIDRLLKNDSSLVSAADSIRNCCLVIEDVNGRPMKWKNRSQVIQHGIMITDEQIANSILQVRLCDPVFLTNDKFVIGCGIVDGRLQGLSMTMLVEQKQGGRKIHVLKTKYCGYIN